MSFSRSEGKFVRMPVWFVERMATLSKNSIALYIAIRHRAGIHSETVPTSFEADCHGKGLLELAGLSRSRAYVALQELEEFGLIRRSNTGIEVVVSDETLQSSPRSGTDPEKQNPISGTKNPISGTNRPISGTNRPRSGIRSSTTISENENERESAGASSRRPRECNKIKNYTGSGNPRDFLIWFSNQYEARIGQPYQISWKKDSAIISRLMETYGPDVLGEMAVELLRTGDDWIREKMGRSIQALAKFSAKFSELVQSKRNKRAATQKNGNGASSDHERRIRRERLLEDLQKAEERYGTERARILHADKYSYAESLQD